MQEPLVTPRYEHTFELLALWEASLHPRPRLREPVPKQVIILPHLKLVTFIFSHLDPGHQKLPQLVSLASQMPVTAFVF